jgi:hypothetical protein
MNLNLHCIQITFIAMFIISYVDYEKDVKLENKLGNLIQHNKIIHN